MRQILALYLQRQGYEVETADDGLAAWNLVAANPGRFDVVITDNQMPNMSGIALVEKLRASGYPGRIVFFSSTLPQQSAERLLRLQVDAVLEKGRPITDLIAVLRRAPG
jgi:CheY-like chemotaxis protein